MSNYLTTKDLCELLKVSRVTLLKWRKEGMPYEKFGKLVRFDKDKVLEWLKNRGNKA